MSESDEVRANADDIKALGDLSEKLRAVLSPGHSFGNVVFTADGALLAEVRGMFDDADAFDAQIQSLARARDKRQRHAWDLLAEAAGIDPSVRSYRFDRKAGNVTDYGPSRYLGISESDDGRRDEK